MQIKEKLFEKIINQWLKIQEDLKSTMRNFKICYEVQNLAIYDDGNAEPGGICLTLEGLTDEGCDKIAARLAETNPLDVLSGFFDADNILKAHEPTDFWLITPEEYALKYGDIN